MEALFIGCLLPSLSVIYTDLRYRKIYNWLTVPLFLTGIGYALYTNTIIDALAGSAFAFVVFIICGLMAGIGGGDIKFATGLGAWFGFINILYVTLIGCLLGAVWGIYNLYRLGILMPRLKVLFTGIWLKAIYGAKGVIILPQLPDDDTIPAEAVPFGVPLVIAAWIVAIW
ncbi:putative prepilin peptidase transmembrane protein [hydrocarbon metagenome]|uniref:Putative prepilin peptidase transmembrane protein n=1 Tax=hydrocarbon metagenome TaxID=938273 RepID=A0A0W8E9X5_9ZZZZ